MDRADLELVTALARSGSITAASQLLHVAQPALSRRLQALERDFGAELFVRGRHGATPTAVGEVLVAGAGDALAALLRAELDTADAAAGRAGRLRIGTTPTLGSDLLPPVLAALRAQHPDVRLELLTSGDSAWLRDEVRAGRIDVAVAVVERIDYPDLRIATSGPQPFVVVAPADHSLAARRWIRRTDLVGEPIVALRHGEGLRLLLDQLLTEIGAEPTIAIEADERELLVPLVTAGLGITVVPEVFARQRAGPGVVVLPLRPTLERRVGAVVRAGELPPLVGHVVDAVRANL